MSPERLQKIEELFSLTIEQEPSNRGAFLKEICAGDEEVYKEVESLLQHHEDVERFFGTTAIDLLAQSLAADEVQLTPGQSLGTYQILSMLGEGGMGEVYLAQDTKLSRKVALKILPLYIFRNDSYLSRFKREAMSASALNHPNIITIYDIEEIEGKHFIVTEYVEGETLRQRLVRDRIKINEALDITSQVASALAAAHKAGIIHCDIKPENIMLRPDGLVKILDFGIAKLIENPLVDTLPLQGIATAAPGIIMGTVQYMSPEQRKGANVDARTDIWSLGAVLYETITGHVSFELEEPNDLTLTPSLLIAPDELLRIVKKALHKDREERYQTIEEMAADLNKLRRSLDIGAEPKPFSYVKVVTAAIAALTVVGLSFGAYTFLKRGNTPAPFQRVKLTKLTNSNNVRNAAVSPDGKYVVYVSEENGQQSIRRREVATTGDVQLTPPVSVRIAGLTFSRDGNYIYCYIDCCALYRMPVQGGDPQKVITDINSPVTLSKDGKQIAFVRYYPNDRRALVIANSDGTAERQLAVHQKPDFFTLYGPAWSPNGEIIATAAGSYEDGYYYYVLGAQTDNGLEKRLTPEKWWWIEQLAWTPDGKGLVMTATGRTSTLPNQVWYLSYPDGEARQITNDTNNYQGVSLSTDGGTIATVQNDQLSNIWVASSSVLGATVQITKGINRYGQVSWVPDGRIVYTAKSGGGWRIYIMAADGSSSKLLTPDFNGYDPSVSPNGRYIVYVSTRSGLPEVWRMDIDGGNPKQLSSGRGGVLPHCSPDSKWVIYTSIGTQKRTLWKVPIEGGEPMPLSDLYLSGAVISPDGKWIASSYWDEHPNSPWKAAIIPFNGGQPKQLLDIPTNPDSELRWSPDGKALAFIGYNSGVSNIWLQSLSGEQPRQLTYFTADKLFSFDWSPDGNSLVCSRGTETGDVVLINNSNEHE
jgi:serine/threonine protein kinase